MAETLEALKRLYPNVLGRVIDLCKVTQSKFNVAVTVAMGGKMDAVVVADEKTAIECIQYMKEQRVGIMTFLPLDSLKVKPTDDRLRQKGRLVTDVLTYDASVAKAVQYSCGNILLCDSLEEAKRLCFGKERHKAVTLDGTLVEKSGLMTGGGQGIEKARRWNDKAVDELKSRRDKGFEELQEIARKLRNLATEQQVRPLTSVYVVSVARLHRLMLQLHALTYVCRWTLQSVV
jgi:structural maintenance of chromosome 1